MENLTRLFVVPTRTDTKDSAASGEALYTYYLEANGLLIEFGSHEISDETQSIQEFTKGTQERIKKLLEAMKTGTEAEVEDYRMGARKIGERYAKTCVPQVVRDFVHELPGDGQHYLYVYAPEHWIPWELIPDGDDFWGDKFIVVRVPVLYYSSDVLNRSVLASSDKPLSMVLNVVGDKVLEDLSADDKDRLGLMSLQNKAAQLSSNLNGDAWEATTVSKVKMGIDSADIVHFTCHGRKDDEEGYYLMLRDEEWNTWPYRLYSGVIATEFPMDDALVFANACATDVATLDYGAMYLQFGQEFFKSGAGAFIGTFAPVPIEGAVRLADKFYEHLLAGETVGRALHSAKTFMRDQHNLFYLFYCLYGNALMRFKQSTP
jgi:hypothetical protein